MPGPPRKPAEERQRRNRYPTLTPDGQAPAVPVSVPAPPSHIRPSLIADWQGFWHTTMAGLVAPSDLPALRRLWQLRERSARAMELFEETGDAAMGRLATNTDAEVRHLEDRFGLTPYARMRFVSELDAAGRAEASMRQRAAAEEDDAGAPLLADVLDVADPRPAGGAVDAGQPRPRRGRPRG